MDIILTFIEDNWISITGAIIGLIYLYLEYKANVWMWAASIVMAAFYIYIFYHTELYASMGIYIYFFMASIYGWVVWIMRNRDKESGAEIITSVDKKYVLPIIIGVIIIAVIIYFILKHFSHNILLVTIGDALTTSLNIVALWMISRKWAEQWLLVIPANAISSILLFVQHDMMSGILFFIFFIVSIMGYRNWKKMILTY
ncbi:nicotinamide riboside transporter PnuC [Prevotella sp. 10(H)]|uniref:nicotinamide riboside transporter PnuC n=1 Tax=Prevotella sp. 10(H) TaxID=1158294 RepID=UPI0004A6CCE2|nr:nicotinamide riboside transporter PnuC [Prevotella sp. 10(H)]